MSSTGKSDRYLWAVFTCFLAFCIGFIHHKWFFPLVFDFPPVFDDGAAGDAAAMQILAKAILDQGSLLPADFSYGNQLVFLRSSPFIALAFILGLNGLDAFIIGSSLSIAFWGGVLYLFLSTFLNSNWKGALFSILLLLPLGFWEFDYVLGQQSHLSNVVLSIGLVVSISLYITKKSNLFVIAAAICLFIMSLEAPIRGLLVLGPMFAALLFAGNLRKKAIASASLGFAFISAYLFNKLLVQLRPLYLNHFNELSFKSTDEILENLGRNSRETLSNLSSLDVISGDTISLIGFIVFATGLLLLAIYLGFFLYGIFEATKVAKLKFHNGSRPADGESVNDVCIVRLTSVFGIVIGALAVAALNPDSSRHYLWSVLLAKLLVLKFIFDLLSTYFGRNKAAVILICLAFIMSSWFANLEKHNWNTARAMKNTNSPETAKAISDISKHTGIKNIYGGEDLKPLNILIPNINAQGLDLEDGEVSIFPWLTRPSWSCVEGDVLYYLEDGSVDEEIKKRLVDVGGIQIKNGAGYTLWKGPPVWRPPSTSSCYDSSLKYQGGSFLKLPGKVGVTDGNSRKTDGTPGHLVYGPYSPLRSGHYELSVYGSWDFIDNAYVEVVSNSGNLVHGRFSLGKVATGPLLLKEVVNLASNVSDIEVRIWVGESDSLKLVGYSLIPYSKQ